MPPTQLSVVHGLLSSIAIGVPLWHTPAEQVSVPLQLSPSLQSTVDGVPALQLLATVPEQLGTKSSSTALLQLSSTPLQLASFGAGTPGMQLFCSLPPMQLVLPVRWQPPMPQFVAVET